MSKIKAGDRVRRIQGREILMDPTLPKDTICYVESVIGSDVVIRGYSGVYHLTNFELAEEEPKVKYGVVVNGRMRLYLTLEQAQFEAALQSNHRTVYTISDIHMYKETKSYEWKKDEKLDW